MNDLIEDPLFKLNTAIQEYFATVFGDNELHIYVDEWALVANIGSMTDGKAYEYVFESSIPHMPPHRIKGLFQEGIEEVDRIRFGLDDDELG